MVRIALRWPLLPVGLLCLSSCGGGGGGSSPQPPSPTRPTLSVGSNTLVFNARVPGAETPVQLISASVSNPQQLSGTMYVLVTAAGTAVGSISSVTINGATGTAIVTPASSEILGAGTHTGTITVRACMNSANCSSGELAGSPQQINVTYTIGAMVRRHAFVVSEKGLGFASLPSRSSLTRTVRVSDSLGHAVPWTAAANEPWVSVTSTGVTPGDLIVTANASGLAQDQTHFATVTVTSGEAGVSHAETIRVGLWVGSQDPLSPVQIAGNFTRTITDPIRPLAYSHGEGDTLSVHHVYTGELVATIPVGRSLMDMTVAPDGSRLFVSENQPTATIIPIDLDTRTVAPAWASLTPGGRLYVLEYVRVDGVDLIIVGSGEQVVNATTGVQVEAAGEFFVDENNLNSHLVAASRDGSVVCLAERGGSWGTFNCFQLQYTEEGGAVALFRRLGQGETGSYNRDIAMRPDGSRLYIAAPNHIASYNLPFAASTGDLAALGSANNVEMLPDGRVLAAEHMNFDLPETHLFNASHTSLGAFRLVPTVGWTLLENQLRVSADSLRIVALTEYLATPQGLQLTNTP